MGIASNAEIAPEMKKLGWKIKNLRTQLGLTQSELGKKVGNYPQATVAKWENDKQAPRIEAIGLLADLAGETRLQFLGQESIPLSDLPGRRVEVVTSLQAGAWRSSAEWDPSDRYEVPAVLPKQWDNVPLHAAEVVGDSMNMFYPDGSIVFLVPVEHFPGGLKSGLHVAAVNHDHGSYEVTLKEYVVDENGKKWLVPRSTSLEHQQPVKYDRRNNVVEIKGVVVASFSMAPGMGRGH